MPFNAANDIFPVWSPDGGPHRVLVEPAGFVRSVQHAARGRSEALLLASSSSKVPTDWSANGHVIFNQNGPEGGDMWAVRVEGEPKPFPIVESGFDERDKQFSPDGKWIAFQANESGRWQIYQQPFP